MDQIQKILIKANRKDLAQEYYNKISKTAAKVPAPFNDGDKVQFTEDIYQLTDMPLFDLIEELEKAEKSSNVDSPNMFSKSIQQIGTSYATKSQAENYRKTILKILSKYTNEKYSFLREKSGTKATISDGKNRDDVILTVANKSFAMPQEIVKYLKSSK